MLVQEIQFTDSQAPTQVKLRLDTTVVRDELWSHASRDRQIRYQWIPDLELKQCAMHVRQYDIKVNFELGRSQYKSSTAAYQNGVTGIARAIRFVSPDSKLQKCGMIPGSISR